MSDLEYGLEGLKLAASLTGLYCGVRAFRSSLLSHWREDLFAIRNRLWDQAYRLDALKDPAYQNARARINGVIRFGPTLSLPLVISLYVFNRRSPRPGKAPTPESADLSNAINAAERNLSQAIRNRLLYHSVFGLFVGCPIWYTASLFSRAYGATSRAKCWAREAEWANFIEDQASKLPEDRRAPVDSRLAHATC